MIALPAVLATALFLAFFTVPVGRADCFALFSPVALLAVALAVVRIAVSSVCTIALLFALLAEVVGRAF